MKRFIELLNVFVSPEMKHRMRQSAIAAVQFYAGTSLIALLYSASDPTFGMFLATLIVAPFAFFVGGLTLLLPPPK